MASARDLKSTREETQNQPRSKDSDQKNFYNPDTLDLLETLACKLRGETGCRKPKERGEPGREPEVEEEAVSEDNVENWVSEDEDVGWVFENDGLERLSKKYGSLMAKKMTPHDVKEFDEWIMNREDHLCEDKEMIILHHISEEGNDHAIEEGGDQIAGESGSQITEGTNQVIEGRSNPVTDEDGNQTTEDEWVTDDDWATDEEDKTIKEEAQVTKDDSKITERKGENSVKKDADQEAESEAYIFCESKEEKDEPSSSSPMRMLWENVHLLGASVQLQYLVKILLGPQEQDLLDNDELNDEDSNKEVPLDPKRHQGEKGNLQKGSGVSHCSDVIEECKEDEIGDIFKLASNFSAVYDVKILDVLEEVTKMYKEYTSKCPDPKHLKDALEVFKSRMDLKELEDFRIFYSVFRGKFVETFCSMPKTYSLETHKMLMEQFHEACDEAFGPADREALALCHVEKLDQEAEKRANELREKLIKTLETKLAVQKTAARVAVLKAIEDAPEAEGGAAAKADLELLGKEYECSQHECRLVADAVRAHLLVTGDLEIREDRVEGSG